MATPGRENRGIRLLFIGATLLSLGFPPLVSSYEVVLTNRLPSSRGMTSLSYDGEDSIYVVGGLFNGLGDLVDVLKYSVSENTLEKVAEMPFEISSAAMGNDGGRTHFHFGGYTGGRLRSEIFAFTNGDPSPVHVGDLPRTLAYHSAASDGNGSVYILGGQNPVPIEILRYDTILGVVEVVGQTPEPLVALTTVWHTDSVYGFGGYYKHNSTLATQIFKFTPSSGRVEVMEDEIEGGAMYSTSVAVGDDIYIVGGRSDDFSFPFARFNTLTNKLERLEVTNYSRELYGPSAAYVESLHRIYIFGGGIPYNSFRDEISYIQL